ncbi:MAG: tetratricopeptide repeat protein [bacterium]
MYTLYLSLAVTLLVAVVPTLFGVSAAWTVLPGFLLGIFCFVWFNRRMAKRVEAVTAAADAEMASLQAIAQRPGPNTQAAMAHKFDKAIEILKRGFILSKWQIGVTTMLNARIGMLYFMRWLVLKKEGLKESIPYLEKSRVTGRKARLLASLWPAWAMLAVAWYKGHKNVDKAVEVLEGAVGVARKEGMLWGLYAYILHEAGRIDAAVDVLARGKEKAPDDPHLVANLTALQNQKKMNMRVYGEQWYQFGLEQPKAATMTPQMGHPRMRGRRGMMRR